MNCIVGVPVPPVQPSPYLHPVPEHGCIGQGQSEISSSYSKLRYLTVSLYLSIYQGGRAPH